MAQKTAAEDEAYTEVESIVDTYRRRDSERLAYDVRHLLGEHDVVEVWSDARRLLASAESRSNVWELEDGNRGVMVDGEHVRPEDVVELVAYDEDDGDEWDPEPAELRDGETRDDDAHARRNAELVRSGREALDDETLEEAEALVDAMEEGDDGPRTDGGRDVDELEGERVIVQLRGAPAGETKRTGTVIEVHPERPNPDTAPEYVVDLDVGGQAYVTGDTLRPVDDVSIDGVEVDADVLEELVDTAKGKLEGDVGRWGPDGTGYDTDAFAETIEQAEAALDGGDC